MSITEPKTYRSTISYGIPIFIAGIMLTMLTIAIINKQWAGIIIISLTIAFILPIYLQTYYTITSDGKLKIKCGFLINMNIDVSSIKKIAKSRNPLSAPALSINRLEVFYNKFDSVLISPKNREEFTAILKQINPNIIIEI